MNFQFYFEKMIGSGVFRSFKEENPSAFLCSAFFILDREGKEKNKVHFDYWLPSEKKMKSFDVGSGEVSLIPVDNYDERGYEPIFDGYDFNLEDYEKLIFDEMVKRGVKGGMKKSIFSLQKLKGKDYLIATVFLSNMGLLKVVINLETDKIENFEKKSFLDMFKLFGKKK